MSFQQLLRAKFTKFLQSLKVLKELSTVDEKVLKELSTVDENVLKIGRPLHISAYGIVENLVADFQDFL